jgi:XTP/dITP diphosphohydrolase
MRELWIATGNAKKRAELERLLQPLGLRLRVPSELQVPFAPVENQPDFAGNARVKAAALATLARACAVADDSGLCVDALGGRPGVWSARYGGPGLTDAQRVEHLLAELRDVADAGRTAHFTCSLCLCGPAGDVRAQVEARCDGVLLRAPRGAGGFGYDPIFVAEECRALDAPPTFAELDAERKDRISHRGKALRELQRRLLAEPRLLDA